jgi:CRP-like cAMP-binding protein
MVAYQYFGEVSLLLGIQRTASAKTKTQCTLYKLSQVNVINAFNDYPETFQCMKRVAEKRLQRLQHFLDPSKFPLGGDDEVDEEDSKTELFGVDTKTIVHEKEEAAAKSRSRKMSKRYATIQRHPIQVRSKS